uniref:rhamnose-binding lectin-like n=1 Tax=Doryrhamphus excisus TaxID=161450 RepID=UPI0025AE1454|nr:rhamnose-binding lectin-like [Doryrhamphus excisus]
MACLKLSLTMLLIATCFHFKAVSAERATTCDDRENVHLLTCATGVISIQDGLYGRTNSETCKEGRPPQQLANTACSQAGAVDVLKTRCNGKKSCELNMAVFRTSDPCNGIYKYLDTNFTCEPENIVMACEDSLAHLSCDVGKVILVHESNFGRRDKTTCSYKRPASQVQNDKCLSSSTAVENSCNGKNSCMIRASNAVFGGTCGGTYKYLEVNYTCEASGVISIKGGLYGRADPEMCKEGRPPQQLANTACSQAGAVDVLKSRCNGKKSCEMNINDFKTSDPCPGIYKYLETNFTCLPTPRVVACQNSLAYLSCDAGKVIAVQESNFGRRDQTTCIYNRPSSQVQNDQCTSSSSDVKNSCNGKNSCTISASGSVFGDPCGGVYKYLEVVYVCENRQSFSDARCHVMKPKCAKAPGL